MTDLTEKWKKGELPLGMYYVKTPFGVEIHSDYSLYRYKLTRDVDSIEVLAPVPSYEEYQQLRKWCEEFNALDVAKENQRLQMSLRMTVDDYKNVVDICEQLKELLKECREYLSDVDTYCTKNADESYLLITRINAAIGESEE